MTLPESVFLMFLLCGIEAAAPPTDNCIIYVPNPEDEEKGSLRTMLCGPSKRKVMETENSTVKGNSSEGKIVDDEGGNGKRAAEQKGADRKTEVSNGSDSSTMNDEKLEQNRKLIENGKPSKDAVLPSTSAKRSPCNGRSRKTCKGKRQRVKKSKKRRNRRKRVAKAQKKRRH